MRDHLFLRVHEVLSIGQRAVTRWAPDFILRRRSTPNLTPRLEGVPGGVLLLPVQLLGRAESGYLVPGSDDGGVDHRDPLLHALTGRPPAERLPRDHIARQSARSTRPLDPLPGVGPGAQEAAPCRVSSARPGRAYSDRTGRPAGALVRRVTPLDSSLSVRRSVPRPGIRAGGPERVGAGSRTPLPLSPIGPPAELSLPGARPPVTRTGGRRGTR